jgi:plasmid stabilization system protein ParE
VIGFRYLLPAEEEMTEAASFYENATQGLGVDFLDDVQRAIDRIRDNPASGFSISADLRRILMSRFPFSIIYAVESERLLIAAVAHQRRRPNYWRDRIDS